MPAKSLINVNHDEHNEHDDAVMVCTRRTIETKNGLVGSRTRASFIPLSSTARSKPIALGGGHSHNSNAFARRFRRSCRLDSNSHRIFPFCGATPVRSRAARAMVTNMSAPRWRSEEHTSELQSLMRISYAVFCLKKKKT